MAHSQHYAYEDLGNSRFKVCRFPYKLQKDNWIAQKPDKRGVFLDDTFGRTMRPKSRKVMSELNADCVTVTYVQKVKVS